MLEVDIRKKLGHFQLDVAFSAPADQVTGILGASGCGKSLTLKCIAGIERPDEGRITLDGQVLFDSAQRVDLTPQRRQVGYLFQNYALFPNMTVEQNIAVGIRDRRGRRETLERLIRAFRLEGNQKKYPRQLSGGQQQRVALARILASRPRALLLDEPFSALDSGLRRQMELELAERLEEFGGAVLFVTHSREEVCHLCREVCVLHQGRSHPKVPTEELFRAPATLAACQLAGWENISPVRVLPSGEVEAEAWGITLPLAGQMGEDITHLGLKAAALRPAEPEEPGAFSARVERVFPEERGTLAVLSPPRGKLYLRLPPGVEVAPGQEMFLAAPSEAVRLLRRR